MKITVNYSERSYGNEEDAPSYMAHINTGTYAVQVDFFFAETAWGRGVGDYAGVVKSARLELGLEDTRRLALALLNGVLDPDHKRQRVPLGRLNVPIIDAFKQQLSRPYLIRGTHVLAAGDGRTLSHAILELTGWPQHYDEVAAIAAAQRWNRGKPECDHVSSRPWVDYYREMIERLSHPAVRTQEGV